MIISLNQSLKILNPYSVRDLRNSRPSRLAISLHTNPPRSSTTRQDINQNRATVLRNRCIIKIVERPAQALVEDRRATKCQRAIATDGEAARVDGVCLAGRRVELKLMVRNDISDAAFGVGEDTSLEGDDEGAWITTCTLLLSVSNLARPIED